MNSLVQPIVSFAVGVILSLIAVIGGLGAMTSTVNPDSTTETMVSYDAQ